MQQQPKKEWCSGAPPRSKAFKTGNVRRARRGLPVTRQPRSRLAWERGCTIWLEAARASPVNSYLIFVVFLVSLTCFLSPECYTILEIYGKNPTRHRLTCACTCLLTDSTAAVVAAAASAAAAAGCAAASHIVALLPVGTISTMAQTGVSGLVVVDGESFLDALFASAGQG